LLAVCYKTTRFPIQNFKPAAGLAFKQQVVGRRSKKRMFYDYQAYYISHGCLSIMAFSQGVCVVLADKTLRVS